MAETPPLFQEASRCDVCHCSFTTFRRRHHCRSCGKTLCHEHSSYHMALPQYGIYTDVRVCYECFNKSSRSGNVDKETSSEAIAAATDTISRLKIGEDNVPSSAPTSGDHNVGALECKCGMPLCICEAPKPDPPPAPVHSSSSSVQSNPRPKKAISTQQSAESSTKKSGASSASNSSSFFNLGQANNTSSDKGHADYEVTGEGLREAIKNSDVPAVRKLLSQGVDANYCDKQGFTLLHLAALFNQTEIALILMDNGANVECKNGQGETPLDCAPAMLQYKMRNRMAELAAGQSNH
uniref:FYVE-type domain-containing protein n=1 Tax=Ananas comosus var. bracteatus TaxID=296719 RepID=A0A6V7PN59_ANACO|nr:unnamed protein product [Ananas comosus var. bracteatus]